MQVRTQKSNPVVSNINLPAPEYEVDVMFDCIGVRKTKVIVLVNSQLVSGCLLSPAHFSQATPSPKPFFVRKDDLRQFCEIILLIFCVKAAYV